MECYARSGVHKVVVRPEMEVECFVERAEDEAERVRMFKNRRGERVGALGVLPRSGRATGYDFECVCRGMGDALQGARRCAGGCRQKD